jgi:hypothetical protein
MAFYSILHMQRSSEVGFEEVIRSIVAVILFGSDNFLNALSLWSDCDGLDYYTKNASHGLI